MSGLCVQISKRAVTATAKSEHGRDAAISATAAPRQPRVSQPTPVQKASKLVPGVTRQRPKHSRNWSRVIHARLVSISCWSTPIVALPPPKVTLPYRAKTLPIEVSRGRIVELGGLTFCLWIMRAIVTQILPLLIRFPFVFKHAIRQTSTKNWFCKTGGLRFAGILLFGGTR